MCYNSNKWTVWGPFPIFLFIVVPFLGYTWCTFMECWTFCMKNCRASEWRCLLSEAAFPLVPSWEGLCLTVTTTEVIPDRDAGLLPACLLVGVVLSRSTFLLFSSLLGYPSPQDFQLKLRLFTNIHLPLKVQFSPITPNVHCFKPKLQGFGISTFPCSP